MAAPDQDWDIVSSVGLTALGVAAGRAIATVSPDPLIEDPYAAEFVRAANPPRPMPIEPIDDPLWMAMAEYLAVRSRFFDEVVTGTNAPQVVILAAGLDARAYRLDLSGRDVYEVDQPRVLAFKQEVLDGLGSVPRCRRHAIGADLREDWPAALENAGFDRARPTVWIAEGLLPYLPARAEELLFDLVHARSAPGSRIGVEHIPDLGSTDILDTIRSSDAGARLGLDVNDVLSTEPRRNPVAWLAGQGWRTTVDRAGELAASYGKQLPDPLGDAMTKTELVTADLP